MSEVDDIEAIKEKKKNQLLGNDQPEETSDAAPNEPIYVDSKEEFQSIVDDYNIVLVDFYADWCGPCKMLEPIVEDLASNTDAAVAKVDVDAHQQLASQHQVRGVPTVVLFADGEVADQVVGVRDKSHYASLIDRHSS